MVTNKLNKMETLKKAAKRYAEEYKWEEQDPWYDFMEGAKWQQERSYSEEEMRECYEFAIENVQLGRNGYEWVTFNEWFEQFKKK
jgi:hypothetical protein